MADIGKMWFEMGVRDMVTDQMRQAIQASQQLGLSIDGVVKNADRLTQALYRIGNVRERISGAVSTAKGLGLDTSRLEEGMRRLDEFEKKLRSVSAQDFAENSTAVSRELNAEYREMVRSLTQAAREQEKLNGAQMRGAAKAEAQAQREAAQATLANAQAQERLIGKFDQLTDAGRRSNDMMGQMKNQLLTYASFAGISSLLHDVITVGGEFEKQHIALKSILGDAQQADEMFSQIKSLAVESPFSFRELTTYTKQLAAFNIPYNELYDTSKRLADMSAGLGVDMNRLILAYGQVRSASVLRGQELRQFTEAGIPMVQALADKFTELNGKVTTTGDVFKLIQQRAVPFEMVKDVLWDMTNEGGKFYNMQYVLADTLSGKWSNLRDAWEIMLSDFAKGESVSGKVLKGMVGGVTELIRSLNTLMPIMGSFAATWGGIRMLKWGQNLINGGLENTSRTFLSAKQDMARDIAQKRYLQGEAALSATEQRILMTKNQITAADYRALASSGRLNALELQRLLSQGKIGAAQIRHLATMKLITAEEEAQILKGNAMTLVWGRMKAGAASLLTGWNGVLLAITAITSLMMSYRSWSEEIANHVKSMADAAREQGRHMQTYIAAAKKAGATEDNVAGMQKTVEASDLYTKSMREQVAHAGSLLEKYNILLGIMQDMKKTNDEIVAKQDIFKDAIKATSSMSYKSYAKRAWAKLQNNYFDPVGALADITGFSKGWDFLANDDMDKNLGQYDAATQLYKSSVGDMNAYATEIHKALGSIKADYADTYQAIQGKPFEKQLRILSESDAWDTIVNHISKSDKSFRGLSDTYVDRTHKVDSTWSELVNDDVPRLADSLAQSYHMNIAEFQELCKKHPEMASTMIHGVINSLKEGSTQTKNQLMNVLLEFFGIAREYAQKIKTTPTAYGQQTNVGKQLMRNLVRAHGSGIWSVAEINNIAKEGQGYTEAFTAIQQGFLKARNELDNAIASGVGGSRLSYLKAEERKWRLLGESNHVNLDLGKNKGTGNFGKPHKDSSSDKELQAFKKKVQLYKKFNAEYQENVKLYGADALKKLKGGGKYKTVFGWKLKDVTDFEDSMKALMRTLKQTTEERREFVDSMNADIQTENRKKETEGIRDVNEALKTQLELLAEQYDTYKKIYELTGDSEGAAGIAFSGKMGSPTLKAALESKIQDGMGSKSWMTAQEALSLGRNAFRERFGESGGMMEYYDAWHKNEDKLKKESYDLMAELLKDHRTLEQQIEDENRSYERQLELLNSNKTLTDKMRERAKAGLTEDHEKKQSKLQLEQFKRKSDWVTVFDDMNRVSTKTIRGMMGMIDAESRSAGLAPEDVKTLRDALEKLRDEMARRDPISTMRTALSQASAIRNFINDPWQKGYAESNRDKDGNARYAVTEDAGRRMGIRAGEYTQAQMETYLASSEQDFANGIQGLSAMFGACAEALSPVVDLFDALGESGVSEVLKGGQKALGAASSTAGAFQTLSKAFGAESPVGQALSAAGPYAAAAAAGLSIVSSLLGSKPASMKIYEKQAEYLKNIQGTVKDINGSLKNKVSAAYGSEAQTAGRKIDQNLKMEAYEVRKTYYDWSMAKQHHGGNRNRMKTNLDFWRINRYLWSIGYQGQNVDGDSIQKLNGKYLEKIREHFAGMWARMPEDARKYLERLIEIEGEQGELTQNTKSMAEALSGMNIDKLKSDYVSLLSDLNGSNYQFARKFEDYMKNAMLNALVADRYKPELEKIINDLDAAGRNEYYTKTDGTVGIKRKEHGEYVTPKDMLSEYTAAEIAEQKKKYTDWGKKARGDTDMLRMVFGFSNDSSSLTNIGTSITEDTASLLLSYVNAIRGDESVSLKYLRRYVEELCPQGNNLLAQQIALQKSIEANTRRSADGVDTIRGYLDGVIKGTKKLHVK